MKAGPVEIGTLLQNRNRYCVPIYQRHYVWTKDKQWEPFWQDIRTKAVERLSGRDRRFSHFMGAVVLESRGRPSVKQVPSFQVVDGQQRLTTFQIFLTAAKHFAKEIGYEAASANIQRYLLNSDPKLMEEPEVEIYKIWPTKADRELFIDIVSSEGRDDLRSKYDVYWYKNKARDQISVQKSTPGLLGAYGYFYDRIKHSVETDDLFDDVNEAPEEAQPEDESGDHNGVPSELKLDAIWQSLLEEFKVVEIILDEGDDAQVIFETLNDRGEPLLAADLVRNNIFQRADAAKERAEALFAKHWKSFEDPSWAEFEKQGRYKKQRIEFFLANFIAGKIAAEVTLSKLFSEYKAFLRPSKASTSPRYPSVEAELKDLENYGNIYRELIEHRSQGALSRFGRRLKTWDVTTVNPLAMRLWECKEMSETEKESGLKLLISLIVRRAACNLTTKNYNNLFLSIVASLDQAGWSILTLEEAVSKQTGESSRFPRDEEFERALQSKHIYATLGSAKTRALLTEIELCKRGKFQETRELPDTLTVEHILPDNWLAEWPMLGTEQPNADEYSASLLNGLQEDDTLLGRMVRRHRLKHSLGNLTLVTQSFNSRVSNRAFDSKRPEFRDQSVLMLNKDIAQEEIWNESKIEERGARLAKEALSIWPTPAAAGPTGGAVVLRRRI